MQGRRVVAEQKPAGVPPQQHSNTESWRCRVTSSDTLSIMAITVGDICKIILAVILPPLGVFAEKERCDKDVLINILLTILGFIPGEKHQKYS